MNREVQTSLWLSVLNPEGGSIVLRIGEQNLEDGLECVVLSPCSR